MSRKHPGIIFLCLTILLISCSEKNDKAASETAMFSNLPASQTNVNFINKLEDKDMFNILYYLYFYNGGGVATGDINNDGLADIYFTANTKGNNKLYLNKGNFVFEDITAKAGVAGTADWCSGVTMADVNADGYLDIYVTASSQHHGLKGGNELFLNNKNNTFTESAAQVGLQFSGFGTQSAFFDYDNDGDLDCYLLNHSQKPNSNILDTVFRSRFDSISGDRLYRNDAGKFTDVSKAAGIYQSSLGYGLGISVADINNDGWIDIYIGNDFHENDYYYVNNGNGTFSESGAKHFDHYSRFSMGNDVADYNNDGQLDVVTVDMLPPDEKTLKTYGSDENPDTYRYKLMGHGYQNQYSKNCLHRNNGNGTSFSETALISGVGATDWSWASLFADFDNDGNKDLFISSGIVKRPVDLDYVRFVSNLVLKMDIGKTNEFDHLAIEKMPDGASHPYFYKGTGGVEFKDVSNEWGTGSMKGYYNGAAYADLDNDGNLDMVVNVLNGPSLILKNNAPRKYTIDISFKGNNANTFGLGVKAWVFSRGKMQYQQLMTTRGFQSSCDTRMHFGMGDVRYADSMLIVWPDRKYQLLKNIPAKGAIEVKQVESGGVFDYAKFFPAQAETFTDISRTIALNWKHAENDFLDYNNQYLIPHQLSASGPKMAVGDVNKDGLDDFYVCGAAGQPGQMMLQQANGSFIRSDTAVFSQAKQSEETDALLFDANKDGYPDLYTVSGGNQLPDNSSELIDHFYLNDGKGHFTASPTGIPGILKNKSCVAAADIDKDGDNDLFVGGLADAKQYGAPQDSYMLINDGTGKFSLAAATTIRLDKLGMVTSAEFADINKDGWDDLIVTGEWMPMKIILNKNGTFTSSDVNASTGMWQTVHITDLNGDGLPDILAGNWGRNNKFSSGKNGPLKLYVKDFDKNGSVEQVMAYTIDGNEYSFLAKDELERSLPVLKKAYLYYSDVAGKTVQYMLYDLFKDYAELKAEVLESSCFINDGKGGFSRMALPADLQLAPVFSFAEAQPGKWVAGGNFFNVIPYEGRYDAQPLALFAANKDNSMTYIHQTGLSALDGQVRDLKWINTRKYGKVLAVTRNNEALTILSMKASAK